MLIFGLTMPLKSNLMPKPGDERAAAVRDALTEQEEFEFSPGISLVSPELFVDLGVDSFGLLRLFTHATGHHGLQSHHHSVWRSQPPI